MKRSGLCVRRSAWPGAACLVLLLPLPLIAEPQQTRAPVPGPETRNPDDFELFLENILEAPRGPRAAVPGDRPLLPRYVPANRTCPACCALDGTNRKPAATAAAVPWRTDYRKARDEAKDKGRPLVLLLRGASCPWCDKLETAIREDAEVSKLLSECVVPVEISAENDPALAASLQVEAYPTIVVAAADGKVLRRLTGYRDAATLKKEIQEVLEKPSVVP